MQQPTKFFEKSHNFNHVYLAQFITLTLMADTSRPDGARLFALKKEWLGDVASVYWQ